jgi:Tol biopolymer transport system component
MIAAAAIMLASCTSDGAGSSTASTTSPPSTKSPLKGRIAFDRMTGADYESSHLGTFIADADGTGEQPLPIPNGWSGPLSPVWAPDGSRLVVNLWREPSGPGRAAIINPDGSGFRLLAPGKLDASMGCSAWSPDSSKLLCSVDSDHHALDGIYSIRVDGTALTRLTTSPYHHTVGSAGECGGGDSEADYSPDGSQFVFMRKRCGTGPDPSSDEAGALYVGNTDGTGLRRITAYGEARSHPGGNVRWSPGGTEILFESQDHQLRLVHPDGSASTGVNLPLGNADGPAWSPDGQWIVFSLTLPESAGVAHLYRARPDGTQLAKTSNAPNSDFLASWGRAPGA